MNNASVFDVLKCLGVSRMFADLMQTLGAKLVGTCLQHALILNALPVPMLRQVPGPKTLKSADLSACERG